MASRTQEKFTLGPVTAGERRAWGVATTAVVVLLAARYFDRSGKTYYFRCAGAGVWAYGTWEYEDDRSITIGRTPLLKRSIITLGAEMLVIGIWLGVSELMRSGKVYPPLGGLAGLAGGCASLGLLTAPTLGNAIQNEYECHLIWHFCPTELSNEARVVFATQPHLPRWSTCPIVWDAAARNMAMWLDQHDQLEWRIRGLNVDAFLRDGIDEAAISFLARRAPDNERVCICEAICFDEDLSPKTRLRLLQTEGLVPIGFLQHDSFVKWLGHLTDNELADMRESLIAWVGTRNDFPLLRYHNREARFNAVLDHAKYRRRHTRWDRPEEVWRFDFSALLLQRHNRLVSPRDLKECIVPFFTDRSNRDPKLNGQQIETIRRCMELRYTAEQIDRFIRLACCVARPEADMQRILGQEVSVETDVWAFIELSRLYGEKRLMPVLATVYNIGSPKRRSQLTDALAAGPRSSLYTWLLNDPWWSGRFIRHIPVPFTAAKVLGNQSDAGLRGELARRICGGISLGEPETILLGVNPVVMIWDCLPDKESKVAWWRSCRFTYRTIYNKRAAELLAERMNYPHYLRYLNPEQVVWVKDRLA